MNYNEKLRLAKEALDSGSYDRETIEYIFPELKENVDEWIEKIRKDIISYLNNRQITSIAESSATERWIAWLEKQGDKDKLIKELGKYKVKYTQEVLSQQLEKQGEYSSNVGKYFIAPEESLGTSSDKNNEVVNDCVFEEQGGQKWTGEDDYNVQCCIAKAESDIANGCPGRNKELIDWLKSLKKRMEE